MIPLKADAMDIHRYITLLMCTLLVCLLVTTEAHGQIADVLPQNVTLTSSTVAPGGTVSVTFDIRNQGSGNAVATTTRLRLNQSTTATTTSDTSLGDVSTPAIAAGGVASGLSRAVTIPSNTPAGTYYVWVVADNGSVLTQSNYGNDYARSGALAVQVAATPPTATTQAASSISSSGATLNSYVNPNGSSTTIYFQYGLTTSYGSTTISGSIGTTAGNYGTAISGLSPNTTYHFRIVASNSGGTSYGADATFTTSSAATAPTVQTAAATNIGANGATLNGTVNPNGSSTVSVKPGTGLTACERG